MCIRDSLVRVDPTSRPRVHTERLEHAIAEALVSWRDRLRSALRARFDEAHVHALERRYACLLYTSRCV